MLFCILFCTFDISRIACYNIYLIKGFRCFYKFFSNQACPYCCESYLFYHLFFLSLIKYYTLVQCTLLYRQKLHLSTLFGELFTYFVNLIFGNYNFDSFYDNIFIQPKTTMALKRKFLCKFGCELTADISVFIIYCKHCFIILWPE